MPAKKTLCTITILILLSLFITTKGNSQIITTKLYGNLISHDWDEGSSFLGYYSFGVEITSKKKNVHEISIERLRYNNFYYKNEYTRLIFNNSLIFDGSRNITFEFDLRYKYKILSLVNKKNFSTNLFLSDKLFYYQISNHPLTSMFYDTKNTHTGIVFSVIPSISYSIKDLIYLDLSIPVDFFQTGLTYKYAANPALAPELRKSTVFDSGFYNKGIGLLFGIGVKVYEKKKKHYKDVLFI